MGRRVVRPLAAGRTDSSGAAGTCSRSQPLAGQLTVFLVLLVSLRVLGVSGSEVSAVEAFAAWSLARLLGSIPITPGGLGIVELGLTTALVGFDGDQVEVVAAVLVYRAMTIVPRW